MVEKTEAVGKNITIHDTRTDIIVKATKTNAQSKVALTGKTIDRGSTGREKRLISEVMVFFDPVKIISLILRR